MGGKLKYMKIFCNLAMAVFLLFCMIFILPKVIMFFIPFVVGFLLSLIANPIVKFLEKKIRINRKFGSALTITLVIGIIVFLCYGILSIFIIGIRDFLTQLPDLVEGAEDEIASALISLQNVLNDMPFVHNVDFSRIIEDVSQYLSNILTETEGQGSLSAIGSTARKIPSMIVNFIMGLLATYFFIADRERILVFLREHLPENFRKHTLNIYRQTILVVGGYFQAQLKIMVVIYVVVMAGLIILRIRYSWLIGMGIAVLDMLPVFGTGTVLVPWAVIKFLSGNVKVAVGLLILYAVTFTIHQVIQPKLVGDSVGMEPFLTLFFMYIGYRVGGVLGMILAIPIGMILINLVKAGAFDNLISCIKILVEDFNHFRKL